MTIFVIGFHFATRIRYMILVLIAISLVMGCCKVTDESTEDINQHLLHNNSLWQVQGDRVKFLSDVGRQASLSPGGLVACLKEFTDSTNFINREYGKAVEVHQIDATGNLTLLRRYDLPEEHAVNLIALKESILYVAGSFGDHSLGFFDLSVKEDTFFPMRLPEKVKNKGFDDLVFDGINLLAVDNIYSPKWIAIFDISEPSRPRTIGVTKILGGVYEHVVKALVGRNYVILLCRSCNQSGTHYELELYDKSIDYAPFANIYLGPGALLRNNHSMSFSGDLLLLPGLYDGVYSLDCKRINQEDTSSEKPRQGDLDGHKYLHLGAYKLLNKIFIIGPDGQEQQVLDAVAIPGSDDLGVWLANEEDGIVINKDQLIYRPMQDDKLAPVFAVRGFL